MASESWFSNFMRRHQHLLIRRPQSTSLSGATSFNPTNVATFFDKLATDRLRHGFTAKDIWNMDETGLTTVQNPGHVVATKGERRVGSVTGGPEGSIGTANDSGCMQEQDFVVFLQHFVQYTRATEDNKVLLLLDNHSSHVSIEAVNFCRANGVVLLSFLPHCTHQLQPLDRTVYGPLKKNLNSEMDKWHRRHPGTTITIYDLPEMVNNILLLAASPQNVKKGFHCTGIWLYNKDIFSEFNFLPASVTDRPPMAPSLPGPSTAAPPSLPGPSAAAPPSLCWPFTAALYYVPSLDIPMPTVTLNSDGFKEVTLTLFPLSLQEVEITSEQEHVPEFLPETVSPYPKASPRKASGQRQKTRASDILTDTPDALMEA
ncbi:uncharacterized protein LOC107692423 [Sinocyclocheilus anshuiensis]|uniref:uncharacterized protein LOC107692423 n=1 Tax=Sinocyclocheilus anshuiensis TaxID=1608454 RepID=UPI0007B85D41|nr:PREDICTED: uncharacterized protein LOC107692423 [Sinocyclocheilus anshuiensis]